MSRSVEPLCFRLNSLDCCQVLKTIHLRLRFYTLPLYYKHCSARSMLDRMATGHHTLLNNSVEKWEEPVSVCRQAPVFISQTLTVESALPDTNRPFCISIPLVRLWCPVSVWRHIPESTSQTLIEVSKEPLTMCFPSNWTIKLTMEFRRGNNQWPDGVGPLSILYNCCHHFVQFDSGVELFYLCTIICYIIYNQIISFFLYYFISSHNI